MKKLLLIVFLGLVGVLLFSKKLNFFESDHDKTWGKVLEAQGFVMGKKQASGTFKSIQAQASIPKLFYIVTGFDSSSQIEFGETFTVLANSALRLERVGHQYQIHLKRGQLERTSTQENVVFYANEQIQTQKTLKVDSPQNSSQAQAAKVFEFDNGELQSSTDEEFQNLLQKTMGLHQRFLEKCYLKLYEKTDGEITGQNLLAHWTLTAKGQVESVSIKESDFKDVEFTQCVEEVLSRVQFKRYHGPKRVVDLPLQFSQPAF